MRVGKYGIIQIFQYLRFSGDWIAFGCSQLGQLLVWEWQSETYVLKQQGHFNNMASVSFSPDATVMATGGQDGKVKLWATTSGFCFVTFAEHTAAVTAVKFSIGKKFVKIYFSKRESIFKNQFDEIFQIYF